MNPKPAILDHTATLAELTRCRILDLLERHELTVSELCAVLQLPQSTVSRHLKVLADGDWVRSRRDGTSHFYQLPELTDAAARLWALIREQLTDHPSNQQDRLRLDRVLAERRNRSQEFFASAAEHWDHLRDELFGNRFDLAALLGLIDPDWVIGDLACGTGRTAELLAPHAARVVAVDGSDGMLEAARARLDSYANVEVRLGQLEHLPLRDQQLDVATLFLALHHLSDPARALAEATRVLKPNGRLLIVDMLPHDREELRQQMGHVWLGFDREQMLRFLQSAGLVRTHFQPLPADAASLGAESRGLALFLARGVRPQEKTQKKTLSERRAVSDLDQP